MLYSQNYSSKAQKVMKSEILWRLKLVIKLLISFFKIPYSVYSKLLILKHGDMNDSSHAINVFNEHLSLLDITSCNIEGNTILELGPGDSLSTGVIAGALGAKRTFLIDAGDFASKNINLYNDLLEDLYKRKIISKKYCFNSFKDLINQFNIVYLTSSIETNFSKIQESEIDITISHVCLEHVFKEDLAILFNLISKKSKKYSLQSHIIDFKDHLNYSLNNMRFSNKFWKSPVVKNSSAYTNRVKLSEYKELLVGTNYKIIKELNNKWDELPISQSAIHQCYNYKMNDLLIKESKIVAKREADDT